MASSVIPTPGSSLTTGSLHGSSAQKILAYGSERNFYIRQDLSAIWKEFDGLVAADEFDADGRAVADIRWVVGKGRLLPLSTLGTLIILHRYPADSRILCRLEKCEALALFTENGYFNPHLLRTGRPQDRPPGTIHR